KIQTSERIQLKPCHLKIYAYGGFQIKPARCAVLSVDRKANWVSNLVIVEKPSGDLRLCLDPVDLNRNLKLDKFLVPTLEDIKARLAGKSVFSVVDLRDGYYQVELDRVTIYFDDILIASSTVEEHNTTLNQVFTRARELNIKFNQEKFQYMLPEIKYLGLLFNKNGTKPDEERVSALREIKVPKNVKQLQAILGMFNYLRDFIPQMAEITSPLRLLLKKDVSWHWGDAQDKAVKTLIEIVSRAPTLRHFDPKLPITIECDASQLGIGCVILQNKQPVAFASRSLNKAEVSYPQIEKEMLGILFACNKFHNYIYGYDVQVITDHKPLVSIFQKNMCKIVSNRIQRMRLRLLKYRLSVEYRKGKEMYISDLLSRNFSPETNENELGTSSVIHVVENETLFNLEFLKKEQEKDPLLKSIVKYCYDGWPSNKNSIPKNSSQIRHFWNLRNELSVDHNNVLYYNDRVVIPTSLKDKALKLLHQGHMGIVKTKSRASQSMYWINMNNDLENFISKCYLCEKYQRAKTNETMLSHDVPNLPFEQLGMDIMTYQAQDYLVVVDHYSKWLEIVKLRSKSCSEIIKKLKIIFSNFGIPQRCVSDNSPFNSKEIKEFCSLYNIKWIYSSPLHPKSNSLAEKAVGIAKNIIKKSIDLKTDFLDLLIEYRATKLPTLGLSPSEILLGSYQTYAKFDDFYENKKGGDRDQVSTSLENLSNSCTSQPHHSSGNIGSASTTLSDFDQILTAPNPDPLIIDSQQCTPESGLDRLDNTSNLSGSSDSSECYTTPLKDHGYCRPVTEMTSNSRPKRNITKPIRLFDYICDNDSD
ncbi:uncharacterized protein K02A2.6-like, partial [Diaphorina citri]|uniref:RNA-directed DNA polymerase n=1 Tax=Diaphorina citri TaxID=121845 RepID=A0A1S3DMM4_DIACI